MRLLTLLATAVLLAACVHDTDETSFFLPESGASLTYYIDSGGGADQKNHDDPWDTIGEKFGDESVHVSKQGDHDDPWDTITEKFGNESVHVLKRGDHDDPWDTIAEKFGDGSTHTGKDLGDDDPWDTINEKFGTETVHTGKVKSGRAANQNDPWDTINDKFGQETVHTSKSGEEDPWNRITDLFPAESTHPGKADDRRFLGVEKSGAVFVSFSYQMPATFRARVVEVRGGVLKLEFTDGVEQYVIDAPNSWTEGIQLETGFLDATTKKVRPFLGVRFWRTVQGSAWESRSVRSFTALPDALPKDYQVAGASLLAHLPGGEKLHDDPWNRINELFAKSGEVHNDPWDVITEKFPIEYVHTGSGKSDDDPWDTIKDNFTVASTHTGSGKAYDDPWNTIKENFSIESTHTGKRKGRSFRGKPVVEMLFVSVGGEKGGEEDPWDRIGDLFPKERNGAVLLKLAEVRGQVGRFNFVSPSNGESLDMQSVFAVGAPADWEPGLVLRGEAYLLDTKKMLPLMGAVTWEIDPILR